MPTLRDVPIFADGVPSFDEVPATQKVWSEEEMARRLANLRALMAERGIDAFVATSIQNVLYYTGVYVVPFGRPTVAVIPASGEPAVIASTIEDIRPQLCSYYDDIRLYEDWERSAVESSVLEAAGVLVDNGIASGRLGIEEDSLSLRFHAALRRALPSFELVDLSDATMEQRLIKSDEEIALIRHGVEICEVGGWAVLQALEEGATEVELARASLQAQEAELRRRFPGIECDMNWCWIQSGPYRSRVGHQLNSHREIRRGDLVSINPFTMIAGYYHVLERLVLFGELTPEITQWWTANNAAHQAGLAALGPGVRPCDVDAAINAAYAEHGVGRDLRTFGSGHSCGIMSQWYGREEGGELRPYNETPLRPNMVVTIEPMINVPGLGGFRHHDINVITEDGFINLNTWPRGILSFEDGKLYSDGRLVYASARNGRGDAAAVRREEAAVSG